MNQRLRVSPLVCLLLVTASTIGIGQVRHPVGLRREALAAESSVPPFSNQDLPTDRQPELYQGSFFYASAGEMLAALGVKLAPEDKVYAFPDPALGVGSYLRVYRAQPVQITDGHQVTQARTWATTVSQLLAENQISLGDQDIVQPDGQTKIALGGQPFAITVIRVAQTKVTLQQPIAYTFQKSDDPSLEKGQEVVDRPGSNGILQKVYLVRREDGAEVSRSLLSQTVTQPPVAQQVRVGTKIIDYGSGGASWYGGVPALTAAHRTLPMGTRVRVVNLENGKSVVVTIADRGPFVSGRIIDLSADSFAQIASPGSGVVRVRLEKAP